MTQKLFTRNGFVLRNSPNSKRFLKTKVFKNMNSSNQIHAIFVTVNLKLSLQHLTKSQFAVLKILRISQIKTF